MAAKKPLGLYSGEVEGFAAADFIAITFGGTGAVDKLNAFDNLSPLTTKGDLIGYNGVDNIRLPVGTDGLVLIADSAQALGFRWGAGLVSSVAGRTGAVVLTNADIGGLGTMSTQNATAIAVTGGTLANVTMTATPALNDNTLKIATTEFVQLNQKVTSVAGRTGAVVLSNTDISGLGTMSAQNSTGVSITGGAIANVTLTAPVLNVSPVLHNDSLSVASTTFLHSNQSRFVKASGVGISVNTALTNADTGKWLQVQANVTVTMPDLTTVLDGKTFTFMAASNFTLTSFTGQSIISLFNTSSTSITVLFGFTLTLVRNGNAWYVTDYGFDPSIKANSGNNSDITGLNSLVFTRVNNTVQNTTPNLINNVSTITITDSSTISRQSNQSLRFDYVRTSGATAVPTAFDSLINSTIRLDNSLAGTIYAINLEGPIVAATKLLSNYTALKIGDPTGAGGISNKIAIEVSGNAGPVIIGKSTDADGGGSKLQVNGNVLIENGQFKNTTFSAGMELGSLTSNNTPYIDFHSSGLPAGNPNDFDARIIASNGTSASGNGTLSFIAGVHSFEGRLTVTSTNSSASLTVADTGTSGSNIRLVGNGSTTPSKTIRANNGNLEFVNNAYTAVIGTLFDNGNVNFGGSQLVMNNAAETNIFLGTSGGYFYGGPSSAGWFKAGGAQVQWNVTTGDFLTTGKITSTNTVTANAAGVGVPLTVNQISGTNLKIALQDNGVNRGFIAAGTDGISYINAANSFYNMTVSDIGNMSLRGLLTAGGGVTVSGGALSNTSANAQMELGALGVANSPYIDFHSSATNNDFDVRIIASGGGATSGLGVLTFNAANSSFQGLLKVTTNNTSDAFTITDIGGNGANIRLNGNGATTPNKSIRAQNGRLEFINSAYSAIVASMGDDGAFTSASFVTGSFFNGAGTGLTGNALSLNSGTARQLEGDATNWGNFRLNSVANMLGWRNFGNGHVVFDASNALSPSGSAINSTNAAVAWTSSYPTLMGWNGSTTYGVRVDSARISNECSGNANTANSASNTSSFLSVSGSFLASTSAGTSFSSCIQVREPGLVNSSLGTSMQYSPRLAWHWSAVVASSIAIEPSGRMQIANNPGTASEDLLVKELYATGNVTAFSDERLKTNWRSLSNDFIESLANLKHGIYDRIDLDGQTQIGVSAQSLQSFMPQAVMQENDEMKTLSVVYGNAAMVSCVQLAKEVMSLRNRLSKLEKTT
jgi:hypothetical protein